MDAITHLLVGRLLAATLGAESAQLGWLVTLFAILPDFDTITWAVPRLRRYLTHRGFTHTLPFGVAASALAGILYAILGWASFPVAAGLALLAFLSHLGLDILNWGAPVLWPWSKRRIEWTVHAGFAWSAGISGAGILVLAVLQALAPARLAVAAAAMGMAFAGYLAFRAALKWNAIRRNPGRRVLPTGNPFVWRLG